MYFALHHLAFIELQKICKQYQFVEALMIKDSQIVF